jgi:predicted nucleotidyltransferase
MEIKASASPLDHHEVIKTLSSHWRMRFPPQPSVRALFRVGSHSHGTYIPPADPNGIDDVDYMVIVIPPLHHVIGLDRFETATIKEGNIDCVVYEWSKYIRLLLKSNPNVLGTLWLQDRDTYWRGGSLPTEPFVSTQAYPAFVGYAKAQLHKMTHHVHLGYMGDKRKKLVEQYGYDVKNAAHLIRLLRMSIEYLRSGKMTVFRPDAEELKQIKQGRWKLEDVVQEAQGLFVDAEKALAESTLPSAPDRAAAEAIMIEEYKWMWRIECVD